MSIMCCVYVPEGIVMAADSRLTRTKPTKDPVVLPSADPSTKTVLISETTYTLSDNTQKVLLIKKVNVGVSFCGNAIIDGMTVADFIRRFEIEKVSPSDTTEEVARKLSEYYKGNGTHFFVCGYNEDIPFVYDVINGYTRSNISTSTVNQAAPKDAANDGDVQEQEIGVPENLLLKNVDETATSEAPIITFGALWAGQKTAISKIVNNPPILNADWNTMPLKDAIDFAEFLIDTTIKYERFCDDIQTCGGDVDILVITKDEAFWKQHKIYRPTR